MKRAVLILTIAALFLAFMVGHAFAQTTQNADITVDIGGTYTITFGNTTEIDFGSVNIPATGTAQAFAMSKPWTVVFLGSTNAWEVNYMVDDGAGNPGLTDGTNTLTDIAIAQGANAVAKTNGPDNPTFTYTDGNMALAGGNDFIVADGQARGTYTYTPGANDMTLTITPSAIAGTYTGRLVVTLQNTP